MGGIRGGRESEHLAETLLWAQEAGRGRTPCHLRTRTHAHRTRAAGRLLRTFKNNDLDAQANSLNCADLFNPPLAAECWPGRRPPVLMPLLLWRLRRSRTSSPGRYTQGSLSCSDPRPSAPQPVSGLQQAAPPCRKSTNRVNAWFNWRPTVTAPAGVDLS